MIGEVYSSHQTFFYLQFTRFTLHFTLLWTVRGGGGRLPEQIDGHGKWDKELTETASLVSLYNNNNNVQTQTLVECNSLPGHQNPMQHL